MWSLFVHSHSFGSVLQSMQNMPNVPWSNARTKPTLIYSFVHVHVCLESKHGSASHVNHGETSFCVQKSDKRASTTIQTDLYTRCTSSRPPIYSPLLSSATTSVVGICLEHTLNYLPFEVEWSLISVMCSWKLGKNNYLKKKKKKKKKKKSFFSTPRSQVRRFFAFTRWR